MKQIASLQTSFRLLKHFNYLFTKMKNKETISCHNRQYSLKKRPKHLKKRKLKKIAANGFDPPTSEL